MRLLEALYEARISTTNIWRAQGWFIRYPPRRTVQQEAQGAMQIYQREGLSKTAQWIEPSETLLEDDIAADADTLEATNGRLHATLIQEIHNLMEEPVHLSASSYIGRSGRSSFGPITPASTPSRKRTGSALRRQYAEIEGLGGCPLPEDPLPRPDFARSVPSPESGSGSVSRAHGSRGAYRGTPYPKRPTRTRTSTALFETDSPTKTKTAAPTKPRRGDTPFEVEESVRYDCEDSETEQDTEAGEPSVARKEAKPKSRKGAPKDKCEK